jgi:hypothetical protein
MSEASTIGMPVGYTPKKIALESQWTGKKLEFKQMYHNLSSDGELLSTMYTNGPTLLNVLIFND